MILVKIALPLYLSIDTIEVDGKVILYVNVPQSSEVQRCDGKIYIRNEDGDFDITHQQNRVANLYVRKQNTYSESKIYKNVALTDLRLDLIARARNGCYSATGTPMDRTERFGTTKKFWII